MHDVAKDSPLATVCDLNSPKTRTDRVFLLVCALLVLFAVFLRIHHIGQRSLWLDEAIAANISRGTLSETLTLVRGLHSAPITHPLILYVVEKISAGPLAVRIPSVIASVLAVVLMLCFVTIPSIDYKTAGLSALMLSISAVQVRYAQEVREYSLSVLCAVVLLYAFMSYTSNREEEDNSAISLYVTLFIAPFVQYGLVLFSFGILSALWILAFIDNKRRGGIWKIMKASAFLGLGCLLSFFLTVRYQWGEVAWYLQDYYFTPGSSFLRFAESNSHHLLTFFLPGLAAASISVIAILVDLASSVRARIVYPLTVVAFTSVGAVLVCASLHLYPYGAIRQCLFLTPVLCLFASASLVGVANRFRSPMNAAAFAAIVCVVVASGAFQFRKVKPYAEVEDIQQVLLALRIHIQPGDQVYIYPGAVPAVDFYVRERDGRFIYGDFHQQAPQLYVSEMLINLGAENARLWIVFSHIYRDEDQRILHDLNNDWDVEPALVAKGSALYLACRRPVVPHVASTKYGNPMIEASKGTPGAPLARNTFWDWNVRNSRKPGQ
jgi:hypothetical protein